MVIFVMLGHLMSCVKSLYTAWSQYPYSPKTSWPGSRSSSATRAMMEPSTGWAEKRVNLKTVDCVNVKTLKG